MRPVKRCCHGWLELEGSLLLTTAIPCTSANACVCRWCRNVPGTCAARCNAFADVVKFVWKETNMNDDADDYPVSYLLYVSCALVAIVLVATIAYVFLS
jgi:hypothetical protein